MKSNLDAYTAIDEKKKKKSPIMPDVKGSIDSFNHVIGSVGDVTGAGMSMSESKEDDISISDDIFRAILKEFPTTDFPEKGASFILPSGKFLHPKRAHGEVDDFVVTNFPEIDLTDYPNGYLVDCDQCVRLNDGRGGSFSFDRYITLPNFMTSEQIYAIEDWLKEYPHTEITIGDTQGRKAVFNLIEDGITYIMNRIKKYKTCQILSEGETSINEAASINESIDLATRPTEPRFTITKLTFELDNIINKLLREIAKDLCKDFHQESVLVRYNDGSAPEYVKCNWEFKVDPKTVKKYTTEEV